MGTFLYYSRAVDPTVLTALSIIATEQTQDTQTTKEKAEHFLMYAATHPNATIKYYKSDMILKIHSNTSYLSEQQGRSCAGAHFYLGNRDHTSDPPNGLILNTTGILANVMSAASEAEAATLFTNMKEGVIQRIALEEMQWPQPQHQSQGITQQQWDWRETLSKPTSPGPWTCASTGYRIGPSNVSS